MALLVSLPEGRPRRVSDLGDGHLQAPVLEVVGADNGVPHAIAVVTRRVPVLLVVDGAVEGGGQQPRGDDGGPAHGAAGAAAPDPDHPGEHGVPGLVQGFLGDRETGSDA